MRFKLLLLVLLMPFSMHLLAQSYDIIVALDGSGDYTSIQDAIDAVPDASINRTVIYIKNGTYNTEKLYISEDKTNITIIGESRDSTIISYHIYDCDDGKCPTEDAALWSDDNMRTSATLTIKADGFIAKNLTIENTAGAVGVAQAITITSDKVIFINCNITGYQDTLYTWTTTGRSYFKNCLVVGRTDYIYGGGTAFFDSCEIRCWGGGWITAPSTSADLDYGYVLYKCDITYADDSPRDGDDGNEFALGRPWHNYPKVTWLYCDMSSYVNEAGWPTTWNMDYASTCDSLKLYEYKNTGDGADMTNRSDWVGIRALTDDEAPLYERSVVLAGDDEWDPVNDTAYITIDAYDTIGADEYDIMYGVRAEDCSDENYSDRIDIGYIQAGDYIGFANVDFGIGAKTFSALVKKYSSTAYIKVMLDNYESGTVIGSLSLTEADGLSGYNYLTTDVNTISGVHNLYLIFEDTDTTTNYLLNIIDFTFNQADSSLEAASLTKYGAGSATQEIDLGDTITSFYYGWENAPTVKVLGMPDGITDSINSSSKIITFFGTPEEEGTYNYTISTVGSVNNASVTGAITVISHIATLTKHGAGSSTQSIELGNAITDFYYSWVRADSAIAIGMPEGIIITVDTAAQTISFSGTPTEAGTFAYTITTVGENENATKTGTITVTDNGGNTTTAVLTKQGTGSSSQTIVLGESITDFYYSWENATSVDVSGMPDGITTTIDTAEQTVSFSGTPTEEGTYNYKVITTGADVNDSVSGSITVNSTPTSGISMNDATIEPQIYPNPLTNDELTIVFNTVDKNTKVELFNIIGTLVYSNDQISESETTLKLNVSAGNYVMKITTQNKTFMKKLIVK